MRDGPISKFRGAFGFLSSFHACRVEHEGRAFESLEHAYQAAKTEDPAERERIAALPTAAEAKRAGRRIAVRGDWDEVKLGVMRDLLRSKFSDPELRLRLLATGDRELVEGNHWHDLFWGRCTCKRRGHEDEGANHLGRLLMELRSELGRDDHVVAGGVPE